MFAVVAAPIESWLYFLYGWGSASIELMHHPFSDGLIYVLSLLLFAETVFRIQHHDHLIDRHVGLNIMRFSASIFAIAILGIYGIAEWNRKLSGLPKVDKSWIIQEFLLSLAILHAAFSFYIIERHGFVNKKRPRKP
ncbi:MAG: hypothetical protein ACKOPQ_13945 [Novosphingobium sp.]